MTMPPRALFIVIGLLVLATLAFAPAGTAQSRQGDLSDLWKEYPLDPRPAETRSVGGREEPGSTAGPPPPPAKQAGPFPLALLFLALALAVVGVAGGARQGVVRLRARRWSGPGSARGGSRRPRRLARRGLLGGGDG
jgi:hypothetical protein